MSNVNVEDKEIRHVFQIVSKENGCRSSPMTCTRSELVSYLIAFKDPQYANSQAISVGLKEDELLKYMASIEGMDEDYVLLLGSLAEDGELIISASPMLSVGYFLRAFGGYDVVK